MLDLKVLYASQKKYFMREIFQGTATLRRTNVRYPEPHRPGPWKKQKNFSKNF